jgi:hypothetical protein
VNQVVSDFKPVRPYAVEGKRIHAVIDLDHGWKATPCKAVVPTNHKLFNFDLVAGEKTYLVLDPYGNEYFNEELTDQILGGGAYKGGYTIAIDKAVGDIFIACFLEGVKKRNYMGIYKVPSRDASCRVPKKYLKGLDTLKSRKRPFQLSIAEFSLYSFIYRQTGYSDLAGCVIVQLELEPRWLEVWGRSSREVTGWSA